MNSPYKTMILKNKPAVWWKSGVTKLGWGIGLLIGALVFSVDAIAQGDAGVSAVMETKQIIVGDQVHLFIHAHNNPGASRLQWATIPDSFNHLEIVERSKIDTVKQADGSVNYKQRLTVTGFDSGIFKIPAFVFPVIPNSGNPYTLQTDSFGLIVMTVPVDTTKAFKGIKGIIYVKSTWRDYVWYIAGALLFLVLFAFVVIYFVRNRKHKPVPQGPVESVQEQALRLLSELEARQLWQKKQVKEYYVELTDIIRSYIEKRFSTQALELTTDELLERAITNKELQPFQAILADILHTADLAKFAKAQPLPQEHTDAMQKARLFINTSKPPENVTPEGGAPAAGNPDQGNGAANGTTKPSEQSFENPVKNSETPIEKNI